MTKFFTKVEMVSDKVEQTILLHTPNGAYRLSEEQLINLLIEDG